MRREKKSVANSTLAAQSAFTDLKTSKHPAFSIEVLDDLTIASIASAKGKAGDVKAAIRDAYGVDLPTTPERITGKGIAFIWTGPEQWMAIADRGADNRDLEVELKPVLAGLAAVVDQSDGRAVVRVSGQRVRDVLAKGVSIDLDPRGFKSNGVAITQASHIGILLWQIDETPAFEIAMFRSFADSFATWLTHSAAEYVGH
jgi:methylglutamate dehydrogenase subunit D